ncbi:MAG: hypothetical protein AAF577_07050 [Pseudomonadota bacterium]
MSEEAEGAAPRPSLLLRIATPVLGGFAFFMLVRLLFALLGLVAWLLGAGQVIALSVAWIGGWWMLIPCLIAGCFLHPTVHRDGAAIPVRRFDPSIRLRD